MSFGVVGQACVTFSQFLQCLKFENDFLFGSVHTVPFATWATAVLQHHVAAAVEYI